MAGKEDPTRYTAAQEAAEEVGEANPQDGPPRRAVGALGTEGRLRLVRADRDPKDVKESADVTEGKEHMDGRLPSRRAGGKGAGMLDRSLQERIGAILRDSFADIEQEPLPERLTKLIEALHREEKRR